ncbi:kinetochore protein NUF2 isoform X1 [Tripterygium wilfordii]|uniref:Kinetochore protein NUF2 isoform X1 n=1 Tax=Tripterygium wilfordii TaxID=458696 RepID=A0A7J7CE24_TRIWF|nr:kinetochore protein NUF2 homolog [Tripterygium wilfordii]KAF5732127.1 kinetochore protein NUF2 isoform X1 [Tripterygium wilfordii]
MSKFEYPKLSRTEIVMILRESQVAKITENDLKNPSSDFVSDLYTRLLIYLDILHEEDQGQVEFAALEQLENPDFHVDSVRVMNLCNRIKEVVSSVDCPVTFTLKDLIRPDANNTDLFLSAILNFCLYKDSKMNDLRPIAEELTLLDEQRKEWEAKISQLNADISSYYEARERELPFVQDIDAKVKELHQTIAGLNSHQMSLRASFRKLKDKTGEMSEKISKAEFELVQSVQENANLHSKIVQSPDKLQRALEEKKSVREGAKNYERSAMQSFQERNAILEVYLKAFNKMSKHFALMQSIQEQVNSAKSIEKDYKALKAKLSDDVVLDKSLDAKLVERQAKVEQLDELRIQLEKERNLKFKEANTELNNVKLEVESRRHNLEARRRNVEAAIAEVDAITARTNFVKESGEAKLHELARKCEEVMEQFQQYTNSLGLLLPMVELESNVGD